MFIKIYSDDIIYKVCPRYFESRSTDDVFLKQLESQTEDNYLFASIRRNKDDKFFKDILDMAYAVNDSKFPYIMVDREEFGIIKPYL